MSLRMWATSVLLLSIVGWSLRPAACAARVPGGEVRLWAGGGGARVYAVDSAVLANEAARKDQEVGWRVTASLAVRAAACAENEALLHFELRRPSLWLRGAARHAEWFPRPSLWDELPATSFYAHWRVGEILHAYLDPADLPAVAGYKRALISLFQFQILDGERNETDVSGECSVLHETLGEYDFRKIKRGCRWGSTEDASSGATSRRLTRYTLRPALDALSAVYAEELHVMGGVGGELDAHVDAAVKVRAWTRLTLEREESAGKCASSEPGLRAHIAALPTNLQETTLPLTTADESADSFANEVDPDNGPLSLSEALELASSLSAGEAGAGGDVAAATTLLRVLPALSAATPAQLRPELLKIDDIHKLTGVAMALGAVGTAAAHEAADAILQLRSEPLQPAAAAYLSALGAAPAPAEPALRAALALAGAGDKAHATSALLAAAAGAPRVSDALAAHVRDELAKQLARCKDEECLASRLLALGNLRRADTAELLVEHACKGARHVALAALRALELSPEAAVPWARAERLLRVATNTSAPLVVRAAALDLAVKRSTQYAFALTDTARALHAVPGDHELRRVFWQRLHALALAPRHEQVRLFLRAARKQPELYNWHAMANKGTSTVLWREAGWGAGGVRATLDSAQLASGGVLQRGVVSLALVDSAGRSHPVLGVELWTRGLAALAGGSETGDASEQDEEAAGGLALEVLGARLPAITLFSSQAELLGLVWSGAGSTPTPVLRAVRALGRGRRAATLPLLGGVAARLSGAAAAAIALDAHAAVSLWSRTAAAKLDTRVAAAAIATAVVSSPWGAVSVRANASAPARLRIAADLDFYDKVALCVRARVDDHSYSRGATLRSALGTQRRLWRVRRERDSSTPRAGNTLALGRDNDNACRALTPQDADH